MNGGSRSAVAVFVLGAIVVVAAGFFPWFRLDTGARVSGYRLAELTLALDTRFLPPAWLAFAWYLLPALAIVGFLVAVSRPSPRTGRALTALVVPVFGLAIAFLALAVRATQPLQTGPFIAIVGSTAMLAAVLASRVSSVATALSFTSLPGGN